MMMGLKKNPITTSEPAKTVERFGGVFTVHMMDTRTPAQAAT